MPGHLEKDIRDNHKYLSFISPVMDSENYINTTSPITSPKMSILRRSSGKTPFKQAQQQHQQSGMAFESVMNSKCSFNFQSTLKKEITITNLRDAILFCDWAEPLKDQDIMEIKHGGVVTCYLLKIVRINEHDRPTNLLQYEMKPNRLVYMATDNDIYNAKASRHLQNFYSILEHLRAVVDLNSLENNVYNAVVNAGFMMPVDINYDFDTLVQHNSNNQALANLNKKTPPGFFYWSCPLVSKGKKCLPNGAKVICFKNKPGKVLISAPDTRIATLMKLNFIVHLKNLEKSTSLSSPSSPSSLSLSGDNLSSNEPCHLRKFPFAAISRQPVM